VKRVSQSPLLKVLLEAPRNDVAASLKKWVDAGNTFDRSDVFYVILNLRKRRFYAKALQVLTMDNFLCLFLHDYKFLKTNNILVIPSKHSHRSLA
jgi:hypothetical protein